MPDQLRMGILDLTYIDIGLPFGKAVLSVFSVAINRPFPYSKMIWPWCFKTSAIMKGNEGCWKKPWQLIRKIHYSAPRATCPNNSVRNR
jgi:hypothetical protein